MQYRENILPNEWRTLQFAPFWVFLAVAGADGGVNERELQALTDQVAGGGDSQEPFVQVLFSSVENEFDDLVPAFAQDSREIEQGLADVCQVLESRISSEDSLAFRKTLLSMGRDIAAAEGPIILGSQISSEEKEALSFVADGLNIPLEGQDWFSYSRRQTVSRNLQSYQWVIWAIIAGFLLVMGSASFLAFMFLDEGHAFETITLSLGLLGCFGALITIFIGLIFQVIAQSSQIRTSKGLVIGVISVLILFCCVPAGILAYVSLPPADIATAVTWPERIVVNQEFSFEIEIENLASSPQTLDSIDLDFADPEIIGAEPDYSDKTQFGDGYSYVFQEDILANEKIIVTFTGVMSEAGMYEIPISVCINSNLSCETSWWPIFIEEEESYLSSLP